MSTTPETETETARAAGATQEPAAKPPMKSRSVWRGGMAFDADLDGFNVPIDADGEFGGVGHGPRPKGLMLVALCGCTAMDVAAILAKMKIHPDTFEVSAEATLTSTHPKVFERIDLRYDFTGADLPADKLQRAVVLSQEKYCGVSAMLRPVVQLARTIYINGALHCQKDDPAPVAKAG